MNLNKKLLAFIAIISLLGLQLCAASKKNVAKIAKITESIAAATDKIPVERVKVQNAEAVIGLRVALDCSAKELEPFLAMVQKELQGTSKKLIKKSNDNTIKTLKNLAGLLRNITTAANLASSLLMKNNMDIAAHVYQELAGSVCVGVKAIEASNDTAARNVTIDTTIKPGEGFEGPQKDGTAVMPVQPGEKLVVIAQDVLEKIKEEQKKAEDELQKSEEALKTTTEELEAVKENLKTAEEARTTTAEELEATKEMLKTADEEKVTEKEVVAKDETPETKTRYKKAVVKKPESRTPSRRPVTHAPKIR
jgi:DNA gyrase/topoisomerase IV subunit A